MKLNETPQIPTNPGSDYDKRIGLFLVDALRRVAVKVNQMASGNASGFDGGATVAPTAAGNQGDFVRNLAPAELGTAGSKYVIEGWVYVGSAWLQKRFLTGN